MAGPNARFREWTVLAQDPSVTRRDGKPLLATVSVPAEDLLPGPRGHRVQVIDYDPSTETLYRPRTKDVTTDPWREHEKQTVDGLVGDPLFHQQNVYAIVMATLSQFEASFGRNLEWAFPSDAPQIKVAPHGITEANAFYSRRDEALVFGAFPAPGQDLRRRRRPAIIYSCLSHDIVAHETTHALLDGLRPHYFRASSLDQAAFHEGFADLVALFSVFRLEPVVRHVLEKLSRQGTIPKTSLTFASLRGSVLLTLAEQMGSELTRKRGEPLRASARLDPAPTLLDQEEFQSPHRRGEILVAAMLHAFLEVWIQRLASLDPRTSETVPRYDLGRVVEEGSKSAGHLLNIAVRALDYAPPVDVTFSDYLSAMLTADVEAAPDDTRYGYRDILLGKFAAFGIPPAARGGRNRGTWDPPPRELAYDLVHFDSLRHDPIEVFHLIWENRDALGIDGDAFTTVHGVRPLTRIGPDGFRLRETVAEYHQTLDAQASELGRCGIKRPKQMPSDRKIRLMGGGTLIFDEYGQLKFHVGTGVRSKRQTKRLESLWRFRNQDPVPHFPRRFALLHRDRSRGVMPMGGEGW